MATFHDLRLRRRELLDELEELEEAVAELTVILHESVEIDDEQRIEHRERLVWLQRRQAGALVVLSETVGFVSDILKKPQAVGVAAKSHGFGFSRNVNFFLAFCQ